MSFLLLVPPCWSSNVSAFVPPPKGDLDKSFPALGANGDVNSVLELGNGQYLIGGAFKDVVGDETRSKLMRLNTDGSLDTRFTPSANLNAPLQKVWK
jgi:hypothetical protein